MNMTGFGIGEILLIAMLVLIVFGPRRLPEITSTIGKGIREFRKGMNEIQRELEAAGRETQWKSPPAPAKPPTASRETIAGTATAAGTAATAGGSTAAAEPATAEKAEGEEGVSEQTAGPVVEEQEPPTPRDEVDPAQEFIDPWSTDSSRPTFGPKPSSEPVIAPPTTEPAPTNDAAEPTEPPEGEDPATDPR